MILSDIQRKEIRDTYIYKGLNKIEAIKMFRNKYDYSLKESKDIVELAMNEDPLLTQLKSVKQDHIDSCNRYETQIRGQAQEIQVLEERIEDQDDEINVLEELVRKRDEEIGEQKEVNRALKTTSDLHWKRYTKAEEEITKIQSKENLTNWIRKACDWVDEEGEFLNLIDVIQFLDYNW